MKLLAQKDIEKSKNEIIRILKVNGFDSKSITVCLASKSPRRRSLLQSIIPKIKTDSVSDKEEFVMFPNMKEIAHYLALQKQKIFLENKKDNRDRFVITSDTIVYYESERKLLGKPENRANAEEMLRYHLGKKQTVASAVVIADRYLERVYSIVDTAEVIFKANAKDMDEPIQQYLALEPPLGPLDKAGAYGVQEELVNRYLIEKVVGDLNTVIGFPLEKFTQKWASIIEL